MKIKKVLATTLATVLTFSSLNCNVFADDVFDEKLGYILGDNLEDVLNSSFLHIPDATSDVRLEKYKAIWSNTRDITADDIKNVVTFYKNDVVDDNPKFSFAIIGTAKGNILTKASATSYFRTFADFVCVYYENKLYYIPFVASPPSGDDAYNNYWGTDLTPQKPKKVTLLQEGTPNYYLKHYQKGYKFADDYSNYKLYWDFYDADEIYFLRSQDKSSFKAIADKETDGDFYDNTTKTDGDLYWLKTDSSNGVLYSKIESGNNHFDEGSLYGNHYVPVFASNGNDFATIKVYNPTGIKVSVKPTKTSYVEGEKFDPTGMKVLMNCSDSNNEFEVKDYTYDTTTLTTDITAVKIYARLNNSQYCYTTVPITVTKKAVSSIEITKQPTKTSYVEGEMLNLDGAEFKVTYNDGTSEIINNKLLDINYSTGNAFTTNDTTINVSYGDGSINIPVTVVKKEITNIKVVHQPDKINYVAGQVFDLTGIVVEATYNDSTTALINDYDYTPNMYLGSHIGDSLIGDINKDGVIDKVDAALALKIGAGISTGDIDVDLVAADCNRDGIVDSIDSVWILRYKPGMAFINITKDGKGDYFYVNVSDRAIKSISVKKKPNKVDYLEGEKFDPAGMIIEATYNDGTTEVINDYKIENDVVTSNMENVYITAGDLYTTVPISVSSKSIAKLEVVHQPVKTSYVEGENFDRTGMVVKAIYNDGSSAIIDNYTVTPTTLTLNDKEVTVALNGVKTTVPVTVVKKEITGIKITKLPAKVDYVEGETFNPAGMEITVTYNDGTTSVITNGYNYSKDKLKAGDKFVTVEYGGYTDNVNIILTMSDLSSLVPEKNGDLNRDGKVTAEDAIILQKILGNVVGYGYKATHTGDVDNNGSLTDDDVTIIKNYLNGNIKLSDDALINADIDGDGEVTAYDAALVEKAVLGMWSLDTVYALNADANDDGNVNMLDVIWILNTHYKHTTIDHISIVKEPDKLNYIEGQVFDPAGMIIEATYNDGTVEEITDYIYLVRPLTKEDTKITISCDGNNAEQEINVYKKAIAGSDDDKYPTVSTTEATTELTTSNTDISESTTSEDNSTESTETTTENINNGNASGVKIISMPTKIDYVEGEIIDPTGLKIEISWNDGSVSYITADDVTVDKTPLRIGDKYGVIYYNYGDCTEKINVPVNVIAREVVNIEIVKQPKTDYNEGEKFDPSDTKIEITYNDGTKKEFDADNITVKDDRPLTKNDTKVTIVVDGNDVDIDITVRPITESTTETTTVTTTEVTTEETTTEITTAESTETTTTKHSSGAGMHRPMTATTTETTTEATTEKTTVEESTEATTNSMFADVVDHWAKDYIEHLHLNGIVNGVTNDLFKPDMSTKRGDFALVINKMFNLKNGNVTFNDVDKDSYYAQAISNCATANIFVGYGNNEFKPEQTISREEMFVLIAKLMAGKDYDFTTVDINNLNDYNDGKIVSWWAKPYVAYLIANNVIIGDNGNIKPTDDITRAEMAVVIYNFLNK